MKRLIYYTEDMARALGKSQASIRMYVSRQDWRNIPKPSRIGRRLAWRADAVEIWLDDNFGKIEKNKEEKRGRGRPKKQLKQEKK